MSNSYRDLKGLTFDYSVLPESFLKAICIWDLENDRLISLNYSKFKEKVDSCSLNKSLALTLLSEITIKKTTDFMNSMAASDTI